MVAQRASTSRTPKFIHANACVSRKTVRFLGFPTLLESLYTPDLLLLVTPCGDVVYVTKFNYKRLSIISLAGHYVEGADYTIGAYDNSAPMSTTMMMVDL